MFIIVISSKHRYLTYKIVECIFVIQSFYLKVGPSEVQKFFTRFGPNLVGVPDTHIFNYDETAFQVPLWDGSYPTVGTRYWYQVPRYR